MRDLSLLCTKNVHFIIEGKIYIQIDGIAMGSPLAPVLADLLMTELEKIVVPTPATHLRFRRRYVDDTICFVKIGSIEYILSVINNFHEKIQFTYEFEKDSKSYHSLTLKYKKPTKHLLPLYIEKKQIMECV